MGHTMTLEEGDACTKKLDLPEDLEEGEEPETCDREVMVREYERNPKLDIDPAQTTDPEGPTAEAICPIHGIVEQESR